jgi:hypothetical protein
VAWRGYKARKENRAKRANKVFPEMMARLVQPVLRAQTELPELPVRKEIPARQAHRVNKA